MSKLKVEAVQFLWGTKIREKRMLAKLKTTISMGKLVVEGKL